MVVVGVDAHKRNHTAVAVDEAGRRLGCKSVKATAAGHIELLKWASKWQDRKWAIEDCRDWSRRLEVDLLCAGETGVRVPPHMMANYRRPLRAMGKSDPIDAEAVALAALRETGLPGFFLEGEEREIRLLVDYRESLVNQRTRVQNRLHLHIFELRPDIAFTAGALSTLRRLHLLQDEIAAFDNTVARLARALITKAIALTEEINALEKELEIATKQMVPTVLEVCGVSTLGAAKLIAEVGTISRFKSADAFAMFNGTAPIPVWSANRDHFRLNRGGNRQLNAVIYRAAITQGQHSEEAKAFIERKIAAGKTRRCATRALKRKISNRVYRAMLSDEQARKGSQLHVNNPRSAAA